MANREKLLDGFNKYDGLKEKCNADIERYRKGDAKITLTDKSGNPISNTKIKVKQTKHEFKFGANCFMLDGLRDEKLEGYKKHFAELFNMATLPFYWNTLEPTEGKPRYEEDSPSCYRRPAIDICMDFCKEYGIEPREHGLAYEGHFPSWLKEVSVEKAKEAYERRCREIAERYGDKIPTIEVTNELYWAAGRSPLYEDPDFVEWSFKTARKYFKNNELVINECTIPSWIDYGRTTDKYYLYIENNLLKGAPIDAIGMQYHVFVDKEKEYEESLRYYDAENLRKHMDLYARFRKPLQVTEVTVPAFSNDSDDENVQAELIENLYRLWFSHPLIEQIIYWNLIDGYAHVWSDDLLEIEKSQGDMTLGENVYYGGLIRFDGSPKPAYNTLKRLIKEEWHTEEEIFTNEVGAADFRGFYGEYTVEVQADGKIYEKTISLSSKKENTYTLTI